MINTSKEEEEEGGGMEKMVKKIVGFGEAGIFIFGDIININCINNTFDSSVMSDDCFISDSFTSMKDIGNRNCMTNSNNFENKYEIRRSAHFA